MAMSSASEGPFDHKRDEMSLAMIAAMIGRVRPVFGVCRGFQELNVSFGGTLRARSRGAGAASSSPRRPTAPALMRCSAMSMTSLSLRGGVLANSFGRARLRVNSVHYQGVDRAR